MLLVFEFRLIVGVSLEVVRDEEHVALYVNGVELLLVVRVRHVKHSRYLELLLQILCSENLFTSLSLAASIYGNLDFGALDERKLGERARADHVVDLPVAHEGVDGSLAVLSEDVELPVSIRGGEIHVQPDLRVVLITIDLGKELDLHESLPFGAQPAGLDLVVWDRRILELFEIRSKEVKALLPQR